MRKQIIFATGNKDKMREIREIMADVDVDVISMKEAGIVVDVVEDGETFEENSLIKAKAIAEYKAQSMPSAYPKVKDGGDPQLNAKKSTRDQFADWLNAQD